MVDFLFVGVGFVVCFADTLGDHLGITLAMASVFAVGTLHPSSVLQKVAAKGAAHNVVELLGNKFVPLFLVNLFLLLADGTLAVEADVKRPSVFQLLGYIKR